MYRRLFTIKGIALLLLVAAACVLALAPTADAQRKDDQGFDPVQNIMRKIQWQQGPCTATVGSNLGQVKVPAGYMFTGAAGAKTFLEEVTHNPATPRDLGVLCPSTYPGRNDWFLTFEWDDIGYVKDDEKNNLDGDAIMKSMRDGQERDNQVRRQKGWPTLELLGWSHAPFYDPHTNLLTWATRIRQKDSGFPLETINYNSRVLGRGGVMSVNLIIGSNELNASLPKYREILSGYSYLPGQKYSEFTAGDKVATYGLTALVAGGAAAFAAKSGWLAKFGKVIIVGVIAVFAGIGAIFKKIFGRGQTA